MPVLSIEIIARELQQLEKGIQYSGTSPLKVRFSLTPFAKEALLVSYTVGCRGTNLDKIQNKSVDPSLFTDAWNKISMTKTSLAQVASAFPEAAVLARSIQLESGTSQVPQTSPLCYRSKPEWVAANHQFHSVVKMSSENKKRFEEVAEIVWSGRQEMLDVMIKAGYSEKNFLDAVSTKLIKGGSSGVGFGHNASKIHQASTEASDAEHEDQEVRQKKARGTHSENDESEDEVLEFSGYVEAQSSYNELAELVGRIKDNIVLRDNLALSRKVEDEKVQKATKFMEYKKVKNFLSSTEDSQKSEANKEIAQEIARNQQIIQEGASSTVGQSLASATQNVMVMQAEASQRLEKELGPLLDKVVPPSIPKEVLDLVKFIEDM